MIDFQNVSIQFTGEDLFTDASLKINNSDKIALVGANGSGKSTILKMITGAIQPSSGKLLIQKNISAGYLPQEFINTSSLPIFDEVKSSIAFLNEVIAKEKSYHQIIDNASDENEKLKVIHLLGELDEYKRINDFYKFDSKIEKVLMGLGFDPAEFRKAANQFSGGWQMRIELAKILLGNNDILLMDEPTNHLDIESLQWLISFLQSYDGALLLVSHDKYFLNKLTNKTIEIFNRKVTYYNGNYKSYLEYKKLRDEQLRAAFSNQERKRKQTERFIERFRYKNTKAKQVQSRIKQLEKMETIDLPDFESKIEIKFPPAPLSGSVPLDIRNLSKSFGSNHVLTDIDFQIERGDKVAFVGPNGAGKTTLARIIANQLEPDFGRVIFGHNTFISYYAQEVADSLNLDYDMLDVISEASHDLTPGQIRSLLGSFLFSDDDVFKKIKVLSGGEKSRVALARILVTKANLIVLDEPTNHLDISSKEILQSALVNFNGSLVIVSHDIEFLRPIVNKVFEIRKGHTKMYPGDIDYYLFKSNENKTDNIQKRNTTPSGKKGQKRIEAEKRQQKYAATKDLRTELEKIENSIHTLEESKIQLEDDLGKEEIYSNPSLSKNKNAEYEKIKSELEACYKEWAEISDKLETIERTFDS